MNMCNIIKTAVVLFVFFHCHFCADTLGSSSDDDSVVPLSSETLYVSPGHLAKLTTIDRVPVSVNYRCSPTTNDLVRFRIAIYRSTSSDINQIENIAPLFESEEINPTCNDISQTYHFSSSSLPVLQANEHYLSAIWIGGSYPLNIYGYSPSSNPYLSKSTTYSSDGAFFYGLNTDYTAGNMHPVNLNIVLGGNWKCNGVNDGHLDACTGRGECLSDGTCRCFTGFTGYECSSNSANNNDTIVVIIICSVCGAMGVLILLVIVGVSVLVIVQRYVATKRKIEKFAEINDIDVLLSENKEANEPKITFNKELFEIDYTEIKLKKKIGESSGSSGSVTYFAEFKGRNVAFKVFRSSAFSKQQMVDEFEKEINIFFAIKHPNVVDFYGCCIHPPRIGIVVEYCENGDLVSYLQGNKSTITELEKLRMLLGAANAVDYLHSKSIIHRNLKTSSLLLKEDKTVKLKFDSLSKLFGDDKSTSNIGQNPYIAPEITLGSNYNSKVDVYAFSMIMFAVMSENFEPYGSNLSYNIELKVSLDPSFRPKFQEFDFFQKNEMFTELMTRMWDSDGERRPLFQEICSTIEKIIDSYSGGVGGDSHVQSTSQFDDSKNSNVPEYEEDTVY